MGGAACKRSRRGHGADAPGMEPDQRPLSTRRGYLKALWAALKPNTWGTENFGSVLATNASATGAIGLFVTVFASARF